MTHPIYTHYDLSGFKVSELKRIAGELGVQPEGDKRSCGVWASAIIAHQKITIQKVDEVDEQAMPSTATRGVNAIEDCNFYDADKGLRHAFKINNQLIGHIWHSDNGNWDNFEEFWINGDGVEYHDWRECGLNLVQSNQPVKVEVTSADTEQDKIEIEAILEQTEVDEIPDQDFGSLCRLWYQTTLLGTFYRKIFSDDWRATPTGSIEPYHCPNEDDAKYWLVFDYLKVASPQLQLPISDSQLPTTKNQISKTLMLASSCFLLLVAYKPDIEEIYQPIDNGSQLASSEVVECSYRGVGRREDCLPVP